MINWYVDFKALESECKIDFTEVNFSTDDILNDIWANVQATKCRGYSLFFEEYKVHQGDATDKQIQKLMDIYEAKEEDDLFDDINQIIYERYSKALESL